MKRILFSFAFVWTALVAIADIPNVLVIEFKDNRQQFFKLADKPEITFSSEEMLIASESVSTTFDFATVDCYSFIYDPEMGNVNNLHDSLTIEQVSENIYRFIGESIKSVNIYSASGLLIISLENNGDIIADLNPLQSGIYVIVVNYSQTSQSIKVLKK